MTNYLRQSADSWAQLADEARDYADPLPTERDEDGDPTGPWIAMGDSDAAIAEAARIIEARRP